MYASTGLSREPGGLWSSCRYFSCWKNKIGSGNSKYSIHEIWWIQFYIYFLYKKLDSDQYLMVVMMSRWQEEMRTACVLRRNDSTASNVPTPSLDASCDCAAPAARAIVRCSTPASSLTITYFTNHMHYWLYYCISAVSTTWFSIVTHNSYSSITFQCKLLCNLFHKFSRIIILNVVLFFYLVSHWNIQQVC